ncbi:MAG: tetratricopeptide repeat protein, partial [Verrucomicrobiia bacterium]
MKESFFKSLFKHGSKHQAGELKTKAVKGDPESQYELALLYSSGQGVTQDYIEAVKWFKSSAEAGHAEAQNALGLCYDQGTGCNQNSAKAAQWYACGAEQGDPSAQNILGLSYN